MANKKNPKKKNTNTKKKAANKKQVEAKKKLRTTTVKKNNQTQTGTKKTAPKKVSSKTQTPQKKSQSTPVNKPKKKTEVKKVVSKTSAKKKGETQVEKKAPKKEKQLIPFDEEKEKRSHKKANASSSSISPTKLSKKEKKAYLQTHKTSLEGTSVQRMVYILIGISAFIVVFALTFDFISNRKNKKDQEVEVIEFQNQEILASNSLNKKDEEYLVIYYDFEKLENETLANYLSDFRSSQEIPIFEVDLSNYFNKNILGEESSFKKDNLKVKTTSLIKVKNKEIVESTEGLSVVRDYLKKLIIDASNNKGQI